MVVAILVTLLAAEGLLRLAPALGPKGVFGTPRYHQDIGLEVHGGSVVYNKVRQVTREPNSEGFLDVEHRPDKPSDVVRVGFFGDSYVESSQVPLQQTFFRLLDDALDDSLADNPVEVLAFGISGWGTLHSLMAYQQFGARYDLDVVVYVFVKNDPGDNLATIEHDRIGRVTTMPAARLADNADGFSVQVHRPDLADTQELSLWRQLERHSHLARATRGTFQWLSAAAAREQPVTVEGRRIPNENDLPTTWPAEILAEAKELTRRVLKRFRDQVEDDGRQFVVLYVPSGNMEITGRYSAQERWWPWFSEICNELEIELIAATPELARHHTRGVPMYGDHWNPAGHAVIADLMGDWVRTRLEVTR